jgi:hypothetical protein
LFLLEVFEEGLKVLIAQASSSPAEPLDLRMEVRRLPGGLPVGGHLLDRLQCAGRQVGKSGGTPMQSRLRPQQLEVRVLELVEVVLAGRRIEDDLVECKGQWPEPQDRRTVRQFAGAANKARGDPILWIIGLDEDGHRLTEVPEVDVTDWWQAMESRFDPPAPELEHNLVVPLGEGRAVTALRFLTDRSPYVIQCGDGSRSRDREVPIRDGTGTRSARRDELLRLLIPAMALPAAELLSATLTASYSAGIQGKGDSTDVQFGARIFFEQPAGSEVVMLPAHQMHGRVLYARGLHSLRWKLHHRDPHTPLIFRTVDKPLALPKPTYGVSGSPDGAVITGPGTLHVTAAEHLSGDQRDLFAGPSGVQIQVNFGVAGGDRRIRLEADLVPVPREAGAPRVEWKLNAPADDPWAEGDDEVLPGRVMR